jgi:uncharacterized cupredoxin-like copper-binding protein
MNLLLHRKTWRIFSALLLVLVTAALSACGSSTPGVTVIHVKLSEYKIELDKTSVPAGPVRFEVQNVGSITHEMVLEANGVNDEPFSNNGKESEVENVEPGKSGSLDWTIDTPGTYQLGCHVPGHFEQGMVTTFTVTAAQK